MKTLVTLIALNALTACSNSGVLATCNGPIFALNAGHWQPGAVDLKLQGIGQNK